MALGHAPSIVFENILSFIDPLNPRCFDGSTTTLIDLFNQASAIGDSLASISSTQGISFGTNKNTKITIRQNFVDIAFANYTKICWFNLDDVSTRQPLMCGETPRNWLWMNNSANLTLSHTATRVQVAPTLANVTGTTTLVPGTWYFGAATFASFAAPGASIGNTGGKVYLNGVLEAYSPTLYSTASASGVGGSQHLGKSLDTTISAPTLNGKIGYALLYDRVLSAAEILQIFNATKKRYGL
jgi:hypothetical protein